MFETGMASLTLKLRSSSSSKATTDGTLPTMTPLSSSTGPDANPTNTGRGARKLGVGGFTALLVLSIALIHSDQNLLAPNLTSAAEDLGITDPAERDAKLGGGLAFGLFLVGAPAAVLIGMGSDGACVESLGRVGLLSTVLLIGSAGCAGSALAGSYPQLFVARAVTGVSLAGGFPLSMSLAGDLYGPESRTKASGRLGVAMNLGVLGGQTLAGWLGPSWGWRAPFMIVSLGLASVACLVWSILPEPARSGGDGSGSEMSPLLIVGDDDPSPGKKGAASKRRTALRQWCALLEMRTFWLLLMQGIPGCVPWGVISTFLPDYLHVDAGMSIHEATVVMGCFQVAGFVGTFFGGEVGQKLHDQSSRLPPALMFAAGSAGVVPMWYLITSTPQTVAACSVLAALGGFFATQTGPNVRATMTNITESKQRGVAFAMFILTDDVGRGAGPVVIAALVGVYGRRAAFALSMLCWMPCALLCGLTAWTVSVDEKGSKDRNKTEIELSSKH